MRIRCVNDSALTRISEFYRFNQYQKDEVTDTIIKILPVLDLEYFYLLNDKKTSNEKRADILRQIANQCLIVQPDIFQTSWLKLDNLSLVIFHYLCLAYLKKK